MPKSNYCLIDPDGGSLAVKITANNGIRTGSIFVLWEIKNGTWEKQEKFQAVTGDDGIGHFLINKTPDSLENKSLAWSINTCSSIANVTRGEISISITQDSIERWKKESSRLVPKCEDGKQLQFGNHVIFKHMISENISTSELWKDTE
ncbi:hypothetical protein [Aquimarina sp. RZ0]|uniref:hypothetical protein n=1 Tax=Aquimarina sp. RZ0 TaxID=2607730 RepID=UPI0011F0EA98|nr:hypothetical protein [Aquimarina sp. RZ0]KAA1244580.1 hypothetical protein F0000_15770 [Aquimarina sp. RZ0]